MIELEKGKRHLIIKRDGRKEEYNPEKLYKVTSWATNNNDGMTKILLDELSIKISDEMRIEDLYDELIKTAVYKINTITPSFDDVAKKLFLMKIYKETYRLKRIGSYPHLSQCLALGLKENIYNKSKYLNYIQTDQGIKFTGLLTNEIIEKLNDLIVPDRDLLFNYKGLRLFFDKYCKRKPGSKNPKDTIELPQITYMVAAIQSFLPELDNDIEAFIKQVKKSYDLLSEHKITYSTPNVSFNLRNNNQFASCVLVTPDDSTESLNAADAACAIYSKNAGGIAYDASYIRASGSTISTNSGKSDGPIPFIKRLEQTISSFNQAGCCKADSIVEVLIDGQPTNIPINKTQVGQLIKSYNIEEEQVEYKEIIELHEFTVKPEIQYKLIFENGTSIITSDHHPIFYKDVDGYIKHKRTDEMEIDDICITENNENVSLVKIVRPSTDTEFFDLTVEDNNNYFASSPESHEKILIHNTRAGAGITYYCWWHSDVFDLINLKDAGGAENMRARKLKYSIKINRILFDRYEKDEYITLFDPKEVPLLNSTYGEEFEKAYKAYEKDGTLRSKKVKAKDLLYEFIRVRAETGNLYVFFTENVNEQNMTDRYIGMSNLCCVTGDTDVLTIDGLKWIQDLAGKSVLAWNGFEWSMTKFFKVRDNAPIYKVTLVDIDDDENYRSIWTDAGHKWRIKHKFDEEQWLDVATENLQPGDRIIKYFLPKLPITENSELIDAPNWKIDSVTLTGESQTTYCGEEPKRHLLIYNGVISHNCEVTVPSRASEICEEEYCVNEYGDVIINSRRKNGEIGLCNLASINSLMWYEMKDSDKSELLYNLLKSMDNRIDIQYYPVKEGKYSNVTHRPIGIGITDFANLLAVNKLKFTDEATLEFTNKLYDDIYYKLYQTSMILAAERGPFKSFKSSLWAKGLTPFHVSRFAKENPFNLKFDTEKWDKLGKHIKTTGVRFSLHSTLPPSACQTLDTKIMNGDGKAENLGDFLARAGVMMKTTELKGHPKWIDFELPQEVMTRYGKRTVNRVYYNGLQPVYEITLGNGFVGKFTGNHKLKAHTFDGEVWKTVDSLEAGKDYLINIDTKDLTKTTCDGIKSIVLLPSEHTWDIEVPELHEYLLGNGTVTHNTSGKVTNATEACEPIMDLFYIETGTHNLPTVVKGRNFYQYYQRCWEVDNKTINNLAAIRQIYLDQAQSFNHYYTKVDSAKAILDDVIHAEKLGIKTLYYLKTPKSNFELQCSSCSV